MGLFALVSFLAVTSLGTLYPIYLSYKAIKNNDLQSLEVLLMFWIVMGIIHLIESTFGWFLHWIPFFYQFKSLIILWITLPQIQGSTYVYVRYVHPFLLEHEVEIDNWLVEMKQRCRQTGTTYFYHFLDRLKALLLTAMLPVNETNPPRREDTSNTPTTHLDAASTYAYNLIRQLGPAATAILHPMQTQESNPPRYLHPNTFQGGSSGGSDGYRIPDYDEIPTARRNNAPETLNLPAGSLSRKSHEMLNPRSFHRPLAHTLSSESLRPDPSSKPFSTRTNLTPGGYDEIGRDEASGSENEWLLRKPSPVGSSLFTPRGLLSETQTPKIVHPNSSLHNTSPSKWFNWSSKTTSTDVDETRKTQ